MSTTQVNIKIPAIIVDIDGTIAKHDGIRGHYEYEKVSLDKPNWPVIGLVQAYSWGANEYEVTVTIYMSGRPEWCRPDTEKWMRDHGLNPHVLFMRPSFLPDSNTPDYRPDFVVKEELYKTHVEPYYDVKFAIDDRPQVLKKWQELGIFTFAVGTPWIDF